MISGYVSTQTASATVLGDASQVSTAPRRWMTFTVAWRTWHKKMAQSWIADKAIMKVTFLIGLVNPPMVQLTEFSSIRVH